MSAAVRGAEPPAPRPDFLSAGLDPSTLPGDACFRYAIGGWLDRKPMDSTESTWASTDSWQHG
jgi:hypothetical protein